MTIRRWAGKRAAVVMGVLVGFAGASAQARAGTDFVFDAEARTLTLRSHFIYFTSEGTVDDELARRTTEEISRQWSGLGSRPGDSSTILLWVAGPKANYALRTDFTYEAGLTLAEAHARALATHDPSTVFVRLAKGAGMTRTTELGGNTVILYENDLANFTTAAHEFGHVLGFDHRKQPVTGAPSIMYERGTLTEPQYRYDPSDPMSPLNPIFRRVTYFDVRDREFEQYAPESGSGTVRFGVAYADVYRGPGKKYYARVFTKDAKP